MNWTELRVLFALRKEYDVWVLFEFQVIIAVWICTDENYSKCKAKSKRSKSKVQSEGKAMYKVKPKAI